MVRLLPIPHSRRDSHHKAHPPQIYTSSRLCIEYFIIALLSNVFGIFSRFTRAWYTRSSSSASPQKFMLSGIIFLSSYTPSPTISISLSLIPAFTSLYRNSQFHFYILSRTFKFRFLVEFHFNINSPQTEWYSNAVIRFYSFIQCFF